MKPQGLMCSNDNMEFNSWSYQNFTYVRIASIVDVPYPQPKMFAGTHLSHIVLVNAQYIPAECFKDCAGIEYIEALEALTIGRSAFEASGLRRAKFPNVHTIEFGAFYDSMIRYLHIPLAYEIDEDAFIQPDHRTHKIRIHLSDEYQLPSKIKSRPLIWFNIINFAEAIDKFEHQVKLIHYTHDDMCFSDRAYRCKAITLMDIPPNFDTKIIYLSLPHQCRVADRAFFKNKHVRVVMGKGVTIGAFAFAQSSLEYADMSLDNISASSFEGCLMMRYLKDRGCDVVTDNAFKSCGLHSIRLSATKLSHQAFFNCTRLREIDLCQVEKLGESCFQNTRVESFKSSTVQFIGDYCFKNCVGLTKIECPKLTSIGTESFTKSRVTKVNLPKLEVIGARAFQYCILLKEAFFPSVTHIGNKAFVQTEIEMLQLPMLTYVAPGAFDDAKFLMNIHCPLLIEDDVTVSYSNIERYLSRVSVDMGSDNKDE